jgi:hypothetical protein
MKLYGENSIVSLRNHTSPLVQAQREYVAIRGHHLGECANLVDEEREGKSPALQVIHHHSISTNQVYPSLEEAETWSSAVTEKWVPRLNNYWQCPTLDRRDST